VQLTIARQNNMTDCKLKLREKDSLMTKSGRERSRELSVAGDAECRNELLNPGDWPSLMLQLQASNSLSAARLED
jgi:hypothetical protein